MQRILLFLSLLAFICSCKKQEALPNTIKPTDTSKHPDNGNTPGGSTLTDVNKKYQVLFTVAGPIWITSFRFAAQVFESFAAVRLLPAPVSSSTCSPAYSAEW